MSSTSLSTDVKNILNRLEKLERIIYGPTEDDENYMLERRNSFDQIIRRIEALEIQNSSSFYRK